MMLSEADTLQNGLIILAAALGLTFFSLSLTRRAQRRAAASRHESRTQSDSLREQSRLHSSMDGLLLQLEDISRRINAQIDTKFVKLETVVRDADDRIARLEGLLSGNAPTGPTAPAPGPQPAEGTGVADFSSAEPAPSGQRSPNDRSQRIYELADGGMTPIKIAEALGLPMGEIELVLNLRSFQ